LTTFYGVSPTTVPLYGLAFSIGNLIGPLLPGPLFDSVGRKKMISGTYIVSGALLALSGWLFYHDDLDAISQTFVWVVIFFCAMAQIAGALGPLFYGALIGDDSSRTGRYVGYLVGAAIMILGGIIEAAFGINAEGKSLEAVTKPLISSLQGRRRPFRSGMSR
jgi:MFS family permease